MYISKKEGWEDIYKSKKLTGSYGVVIGLASNAGLNKSPF